MIGISWIVTWHVLIYIYTSHVSPRIDYGNMHDRRMINFSNRKKSRFYFLIFQKNFENRDDKFYIASKSAILTFKFPEIKENIWPIVNRSVFGPLATKNIPFNLAFWTTSHTNSRMQIAISQIPWALSIGTEVIRFPKYVLYFTP